MSYRKIFIWSIFSLFLFLGIAVSFNMCFADGLVINEIVARDAYGGNDWFELYVVGTNSIYLGNYKVVDDNEAHELAPLPGITLGPGEFLVIQATDEDPNDGSYYVPFGLGSDDCLTLYHGSNIVDVLDWVDGDAPGGYSYGRLPDGTGTAQTLIPTPNLPNEATLPSDLVINEVVVSDAYGGNDWIELYVVGDDPVYLGNYKVVDDNETHELATLPGITLGPGEFIVIQATAEDPNDGSYYLPFGLGANDSVTLYRGSDIMDVLDWVGGDAPAGYSYGLLPDGTGEPKRLAPTPGAANEIFEVFQADKVVEVRLEMSNASLQALRNNPMADEYQQGNIVYHGVRLDDVAIRTKGTSSLMTAAMDPESNRYSFKVDLNYYVSGQDLAGIQKMNFNNGFSDPTFMREILSYNLMRALDVPSPRCTFVNLYINDELIGLYTAVEQVDDEFVEDNFEQGDGDLYNAEPWSDLLWNGGSIDDYPTLALKTNEDTSNHSALITMLDELNNGSDYESVMDVNEVLRYFAVNTVLVSLDSYSGIFGHNYYLYEENGIFRIIPWDYNMSFGAFNIGCDRTHMIEFMIDEPTCGNLEDRPLIAKLLEYPAYLAIYHSYLTELITGPFAPAAMDQIIDDTADLIREYVYADPTKFYTAADFEEALTDDLTTDLNVVPIAEFNTCFRHIIGLKTFVNERVASVQDQLDGLAPTSGDGSGNCPGMWEYWASIDFEDAISGVSPSSKKQGDKNVKVTITLNEQVIMLPSDLSPIRVKIGNLEGEKIKRNGLKITAEFDIPSGESVGKKDISVQFGPTDGFSLPESQIIILLKYDAFKIKEDANTSQSQSSSGSQFSFGFGTQSLFGIQAGFGYSPLSGFGLQSMGGLYGAGGFGLQSMGGFYGMGGFGLQSMGGLYGAGGFGLQSMGGFYGMGGFGLQSMGGFYGMGGFGFPSRIGFGLGQQSYFFPF